MSGGTFLQELSADELEEFTKREDDWDEGQGTYPFQQADGHPVTVLWADDYQSGPIQRFSSLPPLLVHALASPIEMDRQPPLRRRTHRSRQDPLLPQHCLHHLIHRMRCQCLRDFVQSGRGRF